MLQIIALLLSLYAALAGAYQMTPTLELHQSYMKISDDLAHGKNPEAAEHFVAQHAGTLYAEKLRVKLLYWLAQQQDAKKFLTYYKPTEDRYLQCYALNTQGPQSDAFRYAQLLWKKQANLPSTCITLLKTWIQSHRVTEESLFERFFLSLRAEQWSQISWLRDYMNDEQKKVATYWVNVFKKPRTFSEKTLPKVPYARLIVLTVLEREVYRNIEKSEASWNYWSKKFHYKNDEANHYLGKIILFHALRGSHETEKWVHELRKGELDPLIFEWRVRSALLQNDWPLVQTAILSMPKNQREEPCWSYWLARAYEAQGQRSQATSLFHVVAQHQDFYGFMAQQYLGQPIKVASTVNPAYYNRAEFPYENEMEYIHQLLEKNKINEALLLSLYLESQSDDKLRFMIANIYRSWQWYSQAIRVASQSTYDNVLDLEYPFAFSGTVKEFAQKREIPAALIYAIMRQESRFQSQIKSPAGAVGLMQLMPRTAQITAKKQKLKIKPQDLQNPKINVALGTAYLKTLLTQFRHPVLAAAAYNAGERVVAQWRVRRKPTDIVMWIETLPWGETRGYLKKVIHNYVIYQHRLGEKPTILAFLKPVNPKFMQLAQAFDY